MTEFIVPAKAPDLDRLKARQLDQFARRAVFALLKKLTYGQITLIEDNRSHRFGQTTARYRLHAVVKVAHPKFYSRIFWGGSIGAAEAYMEGLWTADDLTTVMRILVLNRGALEAMEQGLARLTAPLQKCYHFIRKNTRSGSRKNIMAHYDLGNDFYALFLDRSMTYSCGFFEHADSTLEEASAAKYDRICRKLNLTPGESVMEIGTGWGGFAVHAAQNYGVYVTTTTISEQQYRFAQRRIRAAGLDDRIRLLKKDYRDCRGQFDKLVSIEMIEAVGHQYLGAFFKTCSRLLKPDGLMGLQAIVIGDQFYEGYKRSVDFIKRYIFPGGCLPSIHAISHAVARHTDMRILQLEDITPHYARTLRRWRRRFFANIGKVRQMGFSEPFIRMWEYYLCYCEGGFAEGFTGDVQMVFAKPFYRLPSR